MVMISRRNMFRASGMFAVRSLAATPSTLAIPILGSGFIRTAVAQNATQEVQQSLCADLVTYTIERHASVASKGISGKIDTKPYRDLTGQWRLLARHMRGIDFDSRLRSALPAITASGVLKNVDQSRYYYAASSAARILQRHGVSITPDQLMTGLGSLPEGDVTEIVSSTLAKGLSFHCDNIADIFRSMSSAKIVLEPMAYMHHPLQAPHFQPVFCWKGKTKQEQYNTCVNVETAISGMIVAGGTLACMVFVPGCAEALAGLSAVGMVGAGVGGVTTAAAIAGWLISKYCAPILAVKNSAPAYALA